MYGASGKPAEICRHRIRREKGRLPSQYGLHKSPEGRRSQPPVIWEVEQLRGSTWPSRLLSARGPHSLYLQKRRPRAWRQRRTRRLWPPPWPRSQGEGVVTASPACTPSRPGPLTGPSQLHTDWGLATRRGHTDNLKILRVPVRIAAIERVSQQSGP